MILWLIIAACFSLSAHEIKGYFSQPKEISAEEFIQKRNEKSLDMCWSFGQDSHFRFLSSYDAIYFEIYLGALPEIYDDFIARVANKCTWQEESSQFIFSYKRTREGDEEINHPELFEGREHPDAYSYIVAERRVIDEGHPREMSLDELVATIKEKNVLFYTGAGISVASDVPAMDELNQLLGFEAGERFLFSLERAISNPQEFASKIETFHEACLLSPPTKAHLGLRDLALFKNVQIITENLDTLHEASGIVPYRIDPVQLRDVIGGEELLAFDSIICVGLSYDDRGFLGWYKEQNPEGTIIAIDLQKPSYLGDEDFLVIGDLQEMILLIQRKVF